MYCLNSILDLVLLKVLVIVKWNYFLYFFVVGLKRELFFNGLMIGLLVLKKFRLKVIFFFGGVLLISMVVVVFFDFINFWVVSLLNEWLIKIGFLGKLLIKVFRFVI